jgi:hypothetical protein
MVVIAFLASDPVQFSTDEERQDWAKWYKEHLRFAYGKCDGKDPHASTILSH